VKRAVLWAGALCMLGAVCPECAAQAQAQAKDWDDSYYRTVTPQKFQRYEPATREIDFKNVNHELLGAAIFYETNRQRTQQGKKPFRYSPALRKAALGHATDMVEKDFHGHVNPDDPAKRTLRQRLARVGVTRCAISENVAYVPARPYPVVSRRPGSGQIRIDPANIPRPHTYLSFAKQLVAGWMLSPPHRKNILSGATTYLGCAAVYCQKDVLSSRGKVYKVDYFKACQNFASVRGPAPKKRPRTGRR